MSKRIITTLVAVAMAAIFTVGCGDVADDKATNRDSNSESGKDSGSSNDSSSNDDSSDGGSSSDSDSSSDSGSDDATDMSIPDLSDFGNLGECMEAAAAYAGIALSALGGEDAAKDAEKALEGMKANLPDELHDDLELVANAYATMAKEGLIEGGEAVDTPEFNEASERISDYFDKECGGDSGN